MKKTGKWEISRNVFRLLMIFLILSPAMGFTFFYGNFSSGLLFGQLHLTDPLSFLQVMFSSPLDITLGFALSAIIILFIYIILGRVYCSWVCPLGAILEWINRIPYLPDIFRPTQDYNVKYELLGIFILLSIFSSIPFFIIISPMAAFERILMFGISISIFLILSIILLNVFTGNNTWCNKICPLGAFYSLIGRWRLLHIDLDEKQCNECGVCINKCPYGENVIKNAIDNKNSDLIHADCTNCGTCIDLCPQEALRFKIKKTRGLSL